MAEENAEVMAIKLDDLVRIFQINDPSRYNQATEEDIEFHVHNMLYALELLQSKVPAEIKQTNIKDQIIVSYASKTGGIISFSKYTLQTAEGNFLDFVTMTIVQIVDKGEELAVEERCHPEAVFTFTGQIFDDTLVVSEATARLPDNESTHNFLGAETQADFIGFLVYADSFFTAMLQNKPITLKDLEPLLSDKSIAKAGDKFKLLCGRTKFDTNLLCKEIEIDDDPCVLPFVELKQILQLDNKHIYEAVCPEDFEEISNNIQEFLDVIQSPFATHFAEGVEFIDDSPLLFMQNERGDSLWSIPYVHTDWLGVPRKYHVVIVTGVDIAASDSVTQPIVRPIAVLIGSINPSTEQYEPLQAVCRIKGKARDSFYSVSSPDDWMAIVCYIENAMECILLNDKPNPDELGEWLKKSNSVAVIDRYNYISSRNAQGLTIELEGYMDASNEVNPSISEAETIPMGYRLN